MISPPRRLLAVRLGAIGDVVNALAFAAAMKESFPELHLAWVVHPLARPLVDGHPDVDRVHVWRRGGSLRELRRLLDEVRGAGYDTAVDLQRIQKSAMLAALSGAERVLGYDRARTKELSWFWTKERLSPTAGGAHMLEQYLAFARHLGAEVTGEPGSYRRLPVDEAANAWAEERVRELGGAPLLVNLGASKPENRWPAERFGRLAALLSDRGAGPVVLLGGPEDVETGRRAMDAARAESSAAVQDLTGRTDLRQLAALASAARLFVGCDTGPMHLAAAVGTPVVALFGPADPARTGPYGEGHRVVRAPLSRGRASMEDLTVEQALAEVLRATESG